MISLGVESTAHTFGVGIIDDNGKILANEKSVYTPPLGKGIVPADAADHHKEIKETVLESALKKAKLTWDDIDVISYSCGPGLAPCLLVGANFAIDVSEGNKKPLIPVNHCIAHLEIGKLTTDTKEPIFLYLSGGNTQVIAFAEGRYRIFGETEDISVGNCFDVVARELKLPMPGGPEIEKLAKKGKYVELPYIVKGMDLSFAGIQTAATTLLKKKVPKEDASYSLQEICFAMLAEVTERALAHTDKKEVLLVGGVSANKRLQEMINQMCEDRGAKCYIVPQEYAGDNGVNIAWAGLLAHKTGWKQKTDKIMPNWRTDEVEISWI
jgi:universal protein Kae1